MGRSVRARLLWFLRNGGGDFAIFDSKAGGFDGGEGEGHAAPSASDIEHCEAGPVEAEGGAGFVLS